MTDKTTIVAVTNSYNDTVTMLPPKAFIQGIGDVIFHNNPRLEFDGNDTVANFDHHIDFRIKKNRLHEELITELYHHYPRLRRMTQYLNVTKFNKQQSEGYRIDIPQYYLATLREGEHVAITNFGVPKCDRVVIKEQLGARGSNQVVVPTNMLTTLLKQSKGKTLGEVRAEFPDLIYTDNSNWDLLFFDNANDLFISELIPNIKSEYRLLVGGDNIYGRERMIKPGPYPQANLETDKFPTVQEVVYELLEDMGFTEELVDTMYAFAKYIDLPIGSIDLYTTADGKWGIFEYSTQFAFHGANPNFIREMLLDGIKQILGGVSITSSPRKTVTTSIPPNEENPAKYVNYILQSLAADERERLPGIKSKSTIDQTLEHIVESSSNPLLTKLTKEYTKFIDTYHQYNPVPRLLSEHGATKVTNIHAAFKDGVWAYVVEAGAFTLNISLGKEITLTLPSQGYRLSDFVKVSEGQFSSLGIQLLTKCVNAINVIVRDINDVNVTKSDQYPKLLMTTDKFTNYLLDGIQSAYEAILGKLQNSKLLLQNTQRDVKTRVVGYESALDDYPECTWAYSFLARDMSITITSKSTGIKLNDYPTLTLADWIANNDSLITSRNKPEIKSLMDVITHKRNQLDQLSKCNDVDNYRIVKDTLETEIKLRELDGLAGSILSSYDNILNTLAVFDYDKGSLTFEWVKSKTAWFLAVEDNKYPVMVSKGTDGKPNLYLDNQGLSLKNYLDVELTKLDSTRANVVNVEYNKMINYTSQIIHIKNMT